MKGMQMGSPSSVWLLGLMHFVFSVCAGEIYAAGQGVQGQGREGEQHISQLVTVGAYKTYWFRNSPILCKHWGSLESWQ